MQYSIKRQFLQPGQYFQQRFPKKNIVLHHTVSSNARSPLSWWQQTTARIGTAFVIDKDGTIYQAFDDRFWAHHLGLSHPRNIELNRCSIGIELVNEGFLWKSKTVPGGLVWLHPDGPAYRGQTIQKEWRRGFHWPVYAYAQVMACAELVAALAARHGIELSIAPPGVFDMTIPDTYGIYTHHNVRQDKTDLSPAFPWSTFRQLLGVSPYSIIL
jgi:N-acetyl-anhydromuramyl-L-alanine amidase AmpD